MKGFFDNSNFSSSSNANYLCIRSRIHSITKKGIQ